MKRRCGDDEVGLRIGMARLAAVRDEEPPLEHDIFGHREGALLEHWAYLVRKPVIQLRAAGGVANAFDAEADFRKGDGADEEPVERLGRNEGDDFGFGLWATQLGENIRIEQPTRHNLTSRTGSRSRLGSISMSR